MAKTNFEYVPPPNENNSTIITPIWLDRINAAVPTGEDIDGSLPLLYGNATGTNDYVLALSFGYESVSFPQAYVAGQKLAFKAANANTGACTLNINSIAAKSIVHPDGSALVTGDILVDEIVEVLYDAVGDYFIITNLRPRIAIRDISRGLVAKNNTTNPSFQLDLDIDEITLHDSNGNPFRATGVNLTLDIAQSGNDGLDTGSEASSTWYNYFVTWGSAGVKGLFSTSATAPTLPSGQTHWALCGAIYNDSGGDFILLAQKDKKVVCESVRPLSAGSATSYASVDLSSAIPVTAIHCSGKLQNPSGSGVSGVQVASSVISATPLGEKYFRAADSDGGGAYTRTWGFDLTIVETQTMYYLKTDTLNVDIDITGWEY